MGRGEFRRGKPTFNQVETNFKSLEVTFNGVKVAFNSCKVFKPEFKMCFLSSAARWMTLQLRAKIFCRCCSSEHCVACAEVRTDGRI